MRSKFNSFEEVQAFNKDENRRLLLQGATILSMDPEIGDFLKGDILIEGKKIVAIGENLSDRVTESTVVLDLSGRIVIPGLQDTHRHCWEATLRRTYPDCQNLGEYRTLYNDCLGGVLKPEDSYMGNLLAAYSCIDSGITNVHDIFQAASSTEDCDAAIDAMIESGIRYTHICFRYPSPDWENEFRRRQAKYFNSKDSRLTLRIGGVARSNPVPILVKVNEDMLNMARDMGIGITCDAVFGEDADAYFAEMGHLLGGDVLMTHCHDLNENSWKIIADAGVAVSLTPTSDALYGSGCSIAPIQKVMDLGLKNVGLGVDTETNLNSDLFVIMQNTAVIQRMLAYNKRFLANGVETDHGIKVKDVLYYATLGGARATLNDNKVGSLTPGKEADITIINTVTPNNIPMNNAYGAVVYSSSARDVETVMVEGKILKYDGSLVGVDLEALNKKAIESRDRIFKAAGCVNDPFNPMPVELTRWNWMGV